MQEGRLEAKLQFPENANIKKEILAFMLKGFVVTSKDKNKITVQENFRDSIRISASLKDFLDDETIERLKKFGVTIAQKNW